MKMRLELNVKAEEPIIQAFLALVTLISQTAADGAVEITAETFIGEKERAEPQARVAYFAKRVDAAAVAEALEACGGIDTMKGIIFMDIVEATRKGGQITERGIREKRGYVSKTVQARLVNLRSGGFIDSRPIK